MFPPIRDLCKVFSERGAPVPRCGHEGDFHPAGSRHRGALEPFRTVPGALGKILGKKQNGHLVGARTLLNLLAPQVGLEPTTLRLTAECSAIELLRNMARRETN